MVEVIADVGPEVREHADFARERFRAHRTQDGHLRPDDRPRFVTGLAFTDVVAGEPLGTATARGGEVPAYGVTRAPRPGPCGSGSRPRSQPDISRNSARCAAARSSTASRVRTNSSIRASTSRSRSPRSVWQGTSARTSWRSPSRS